MEVPVEDTVLADISKYFESVCEFIDQAKAQVYDCWVVHITVQNGKVVVYCAAGVSRSAALALMYLVLRENTSLRDAYYALNQVTETEY